MRYLLILLPVALCSCATIQSKDDQSLFDMQKPPRSWFVSKKDQQAAKEENHRRFVENRKHWIVQDTEYWQGMADTYIIYEHLNDPKYKRVFKDGVWQ